VTLIGESAASDEESVVGESVSDETIKSGLNLMKTARARRKPWKLLGRLGKIDLLPLSV